ncbi:hypothetical protein [Tunicatimonas pelagia]|uniref:hypothetical protein n=1 Tax=Tunicatimonas pelagia TaxID=931531 RepID=UPI002665EA81|nr:hypothetical protein [Tunicatimonas pelagia]WKN46538.1 hypothetical protein P0M28_30990 [Tunicatimonas pelagia]
MKVKPKRSGDTDYVVVSELPDEQRNEFYQWLEGQTSPVVEHEEPKLCAYYWDYERWYRYWSGESLVEPLWD